MRVEDQVASLSQSKRLKELGLAQDTLFYWIDRGEHSRVAYGKNIEFIENLPIYSALTVAELGELLYPNDITNLTPRFIEPENMWSMYRQYDGLTINILEKTEAQARATLLILLLETNLLTPQTR